MSGTGEVRTGARPVSRPDWFDYTGQAEKRRREALAQLGDTNAGD